MDSVPQKTCTRCQVSKPIDDFVKGPRYRDGYQPWCSVCRREYREQYIKDPAKRAQIQERDKRWYEQNKERVSTRRRQYDKDRWHNDPEYRKKKNDWKVHQWHTNPEWRARRAAMHARRYRRLRGTAPFVRKRNEYARVQAHRRREWKRASPENYTQEDWQALCEKYNYRCLCCGAKARLSPDHIVPLSRGGSDGISNIQPLCRRCNIRKSARTIDYRPLAQTSLGLDE